MKTAKDIVQSLNNPIVKLAALAVYKTPPDYVKSAVAVFDNDDLAFEARALACKAANEVFKFAGEEDDPVAIVCDWLGVSSEPHAAHRVIGDAALDAFGKRASVKQANIPFLPHLSNILEFLPSIATVAVLTGLAGGSAIGAAKWNADQNINADNEDNYILTRRLYKMRQLARDIKDQLNKEKIINLGAAQDKSKEKETDAQSLYDV